MPIRELIQEIAAGWSAYHQKMQVDSTDPEYDLVVNQFPQLLNQYLSGYENKLVKGSTGGGNITAAPWIAIFDQRLTSSATEEFYPVYLFAVDLSTVTLSLAFGITQFKTQFLPPAKGDEPKRRIMHRKERELFPRMRAAAGRLQEMFSHLIPVDLSGGPIDLRATPRQELHYDYQQSSILSYPAYRIDELPDEAKLATDLQKVFELYAKIVSDPLGVTVDRLVEAVVDEAPEIETLEVEDFVPRPPAENGDAQARSGRGRRRYSPTSRKVGDAGERAVKEYEQKRLREIGREDLANSIEHHGAKKEFLGWDITSFDDRGEKMLIEVKSCVGREMYGVNLTVNEWQAASHPSNRERYRIYLVRDALTATPRIQILRNPAGEVEAGKLSCSPIVYELDLRAPHGDEPQKESSPKSAAKPALIGDAD